jgi:hypothetical protein
MRVECALSLKDCSLAPTKRQDFVVLTITSRVNISRDLFRGGGVLIFEKQLAQSYRGHLNFIKR